MNTLDSVTDEQIAAAIDVLEVLPKFNPSKHLDIQVPFLIDTQMVRGHLIKLLEHRRSMPPKHPKIQVRKLFNPMARRRTWCLIDSEQPGFPPLWVPADWGWHQTFNLALRVANERNRA